MRAARLDAATQDARTAQPNAPKAIGTPAPASQTGVTSRTGLPNDIFGSTVEQAEPIVVHAESEVGQPVTTEIPLETQVADAVPQREISQAEADRMVDEMLEEQKSPSGARSQQRIPKTDGRFGI